MMDYQIVEKEHINEGRILTVQIPVEQLDKNALYTMEEDLPSFIIPFSYHNIDGEIEISYRMGSYMPMKYISGGKTVSEYCELFRKILQPLQSCDDWFMKPLNFVLDADRVYYHAASQSIAYLYIPTQEPCCSSNELVMMVKQLNKMFPADSADFRVKVLESFDDFRVRGFLGMLKNEVGVQEVEEVVQKKVPVTPNPPEVPKKKSENKPETPINPDPNLDNDDYDDDSYDDSDDLVIKIDPNKKDKRGIKKQGKKEEKKVKKEEKPKGGFFGGFRSKKEKNAKQEPVNRGFIKGAGGEEDTVVNHAVIEEAYTRDARTCIDQKTQLGNRSAGQPKLVYVGHQNMPGEIKIEATEDQVFKIGRFDISIGKKQCDFEFPQDTKAVSRRHAVIELKNGEYYIVDVGSSAGTKLDGEMLSVSRRYLLKEGMRVSFGTEGADYVFRK